MRNFLLILLLITISSLPVLAQSETRLVPITPENLGYLELMHTFGDGYLTDVEWSPDGNLLAFSGVQGIWFYDTDNLDNRQLLVNHRVDQIEFLSDDELVFLDHDGIHTLNLETDDTQFTGIQNLNEFAFSPRKRFLFHNGARYMRVWDWSTKALIFEQDLSDENDVNETTFTPDETGILVQKDMREEGFKWSFFNVIGNATAPAYMSLLTSDAINVYPVTEKNQLVLFRKGVAEMEVWNTDTLELEQIIELRSPYIDYFTKIESDNDTLRMGIWNSLSDTNFGMHTYVWSLDTFDEIYYVNDSHVDLELVPWAWTFHPDKTLVSLISAPGTDAYVINMDDRSLEWAWETYGLIGSFDFDPLGERLVVSTHMFAFHIWSFQTGEIQTVAQKSWGAVFFDDNYIITTTRCPQALLDSTTLEVIHEFECISEILYWEPAGKYQIVSKGWETFQIWDMVENNRGQSFEGHSDYVYDVDFNADKSQIASVSGDRTIRLWDTTSGGQTNQFDWYHDKTLPSIVKFSPDSKTLTVGGFDGVVQLLDLATGQSTLLEPASDGITELRYINDGQNLFVSTENSIYVWDILSLRLQYSIEQLKLDWRHRIYIDDTLLAFTQNKQQFCEPYDNCLLFFNIQDGTLIHRIPDVSQFTFSDDTTLLAVNQHDQINLFGVPSE